jgi:WD40 repeat protein
MNSTRILNAGGRRGRIALGKALALFIILLVVFSLPVHVSAQRSDQCWAGSSQYRIGETVTISASLSSSDEYYLLIWKPDGSSTQYDLGYGSGMRNVRGTAGPPTGLRTVELWDVDTGDLVATCGFTVTGGSNKLVTLTVIVKDLNTGKALAGAEVYLDGAYGGMSDRRGKVTVRVSVGTHDLDIYMNGYTDYSATITVTRNTSCIAYLSQALWHR